MVDWYGPDKPVYVPDLGRTGSMSFPENAGSVQRRNHSCQSIGLKMISTGDPEMIHQLEA